MNNLINILLMRCPRCHEGGLFQTNKYYHFKAFMGMDSHCSHCNLRFEREPGFFLGSMYISYALNVAVFVNFFLADVLFFKIKSTYVFIAIYVLIVALSFSLIYRLARSIWIHIFVKFEPDNHHEF
jgi:uncharacterized protein (DUF983 family)